jgi:ribonuclease P protein subunit RPR2
VRQKKGKVQAAKIAKKLIQMSVDTAGNDIQLAKKQAEEARKLLLRFNIRLDWRLRRFYCHGCKALIVPGVNARVRLAGGSRKILVVTCSECGHVNRKVLKNQGSLK